MRTLGCEANSVLWNTGIEANRKIVSSRKRRLSYVSNIYMIDDPKNPENNGKVFLFRYGAKIFEKIESAMVPQFADEIAFIPFDLWEGANFKLKIRKVEGYQNYDKSEFETQSALFDDDDRMEKVWARTYPLLPIIDDKEFKSFEDIQARLDKVLGLGGTVRTTAEQARVAPKPKPADESHDDDFDMAYFESLVDSD